MALAFSFTFCSSFMKPAPREVSVARRWRGGSRRWRKDAGVNTGLLLEESILGVSISMVPPSSFTGSFQSLALPEVSRRIGHVLPPTRLVRLVDNGRVVSIGRRPEALRRVQVNAGLGRHAVAS